MRVRHIVFSRRTLGRDLERLIVLAGGGGVLTIGIVSATGRRLMRRLIFPRYAPVYRRAVALARTAREETVVAEWNVPGPAISAFRILATPTPEPGIHIEARGDGCSVMRIEGLAELLALERALDALEEKARMKGARRSARTHRLKATGTERF